MEKLLFLLLYTFCIINTPVMAQYNKKLRNKILKDQSKMSTPRNLIESIKLIRTSIVRIESIYEVQESGTGFFINNEGYIITNNHVVEGYYNSKITTKKLKIQLVTGPTNINGIIMYGNSIGFDCSIIERDVVNDLALLKIDNSFFGPGSRVTIEDVNLNRLYNLKFINRSVDEGTQIAVSGYPSGASSLVTNVGYVATSRLGDGNYDADMQMNHGNSGGPVYLANTGEIIGVAVSIALVPTEIRNKKGEIIPQSEIDKLQYLYNENNGSGNMKAIPLSEIVFFYNKGICQIIGLEHVIKLCKNHNIVIK